MRDDTPDMRTAFGSYVETQDKSHDDAWVLWVENPWGVKQIIIISVPFLDDICEQSAIFKIIG